MTARGDDTRRWSLTAPAVLVVLGIAVGSVVVAWIVRAQVQEQEDRALEQQSAEVSLAVVSGVSEARSALRVLASVPITPPGSSEIFAMSSGPLLIDGVRAVAVAERQGADFVLLAAVGEDLVAGASLTGDRADLARRAAAAPDFVSMVVRDDAGSHLAYALAAEGGDRVVIRERTIDPATPVASVRGQAFGDLDIALYAAATPEPRSLVLTSSSTLPLLDGTHTETLPVGDDEWLLVAARRGSLVTSFTRHAPLATLVAGLVLAALLGVLVEALARRRSYALGLVEVRTAELEAALRERSRLEGDARRASEAAAAANHSKSEFLSRMSHELRTPLNAVLGFSQLLELEDLTEPQREAVGQIGKGGRHLLGLINEVLDITRIESGNFALSPEAVLASDVLGEAVDLMRSLADGQRIHLVGDTAATCDVHVFADRQRLKQILLNLLSNAVKYNRVGGTVAVSCSTTGDRLRLKVADTGPGIPPDSLGLLFEPFERLGAEHGDVEGTGIGLALSRRLAEAMGGSLDVDTTIGRGSTFWVELPIVEGPVERFVRLEPRIAAGAQSQPERQHTIVYIEDNLSNLRLVERVVERRRDVQLVAAMQGRLGLDLVRQHHPLAVLLDLHLPDIDGEEILRELRDDPATASIPVIILSADATPGHVQRLLASGAHSYLTKPLEVRQLLDTIGLLADGN